MRKYAVFFGLISLATTLLSSPLLAATPTVVSQSATTITQPSIVITAFGGGQPDFIELYNQSSTPVFLGDKTVDMAISGTDTTGLDSEEGSTIELPAAWLLPKKYLMIQRGALPVGTPTSSPLMHVVYYDYVSSLQNSTLINITFDDVKVEPLVLAQNQWMQHKQRGASAIKMTGLVDTDYGVAKSNTPSGNADALYVPPNSTDGLEVVEILANARSCSPTEEALDCGDYVKLYNPTDEPIDLNQFRLRSDSGGVKSSATNTVSLGGFLQPGAYATIAVRDSGDPISLTNTGGFIWIEDIHGTTTYEPVISYPDMSAVSNKGMSWALDSEDNTWKLMVPAPGSNNYWAPLPVALPTIVPTAVDCGVGRERNPETNRCRNIVSTLASSPIPCKAGQERNPETNRCRSVLGVSTTLTPCGANETRNPETNRCKKNTIATSTLKPCAPGQERNPETNRCRSSVAAKNASAKVTDISTEQVQDTKAWWLTGAVIVAALGYAVYEWRQDIWLKLKHLKR